METLSMIESMKAEMKSLKKGVKVGQSSSLDRDSEAKVKAPKTLVFKDVRDVQEVGNFLGTLLELLQV